MNKTFATEVLVGLFVILGVLCFGFFAVNLGGFSFREEGYPLTAKFMSISGLKEGASVEIAGVKVGKVTKITLDGAQAKVELAISDPHIKLEDDAMASIRTRGLIGEKFVKITLGASNEYLSPGSEIVETEPVVEIEELIGKFIYGKDEPKAPKKSN